jgi:hypothetical protein
LVLIIPYSYQLYYCLTIDCGKSTGFPLLNTASAYYPNITQQGIRRCGGSSGSGSSTTSGSLRENDTVDHESHSNNNNNTNRTHRPGEAFCYELQYQLEECVVQDEILAKKVLNDRQRQIRKASKNMNKSKRMKGSDKSNAAATAMTGTATATDIVGSTIL